MGIDWKAPEFVRLFRAGNALALGNVYREYARLVDHVLAAGFVIRRGKRTVAGVADRDRREDLRQEIFARVFSTHARQRLDPALDFGKYLLATARNLLVDTHRRLGRERRRTVAIWHEQSPAALGGEPLAAWTAPAVVRTAELFTARLESPLRDVYHLRFVLETSQRKAAHTLGVSRQNLRTLETRLKRELARELEAGG